MTIHFVIDLVYGNEGNPGVKLFTTEAAAIAEETRLLSENDDNENYLVIRNSAELES